MDVGIFPLAKTDLGPAAKTLVEKVASAIGTLYRPLETIVQARADVTAEKIRAKGEIEVEGVRKRALERLAAEETKRQQNLEAIYGKTYQLLDSAVDSATINQMDDDWIVHHSEKARLVSDEEMQTLWARVLASEAQTPGSYSRRALEMLSVLEKTEAHLFTLACRFIVRTNGEAIPAVFYPETDPRGFPSVYTNLGLDHKALVHLHTIGLLFYTSPFLTDQWREYDSPIIELEYFGEHRGFQIPRAPVQPGQPPSDKYGVTYGCVGLSKVGQELVKIAGAEPVEGFFDFLELQWVSKGISRLTSPQR